MAEAISSFTIIKPQKLTSSPHHHPHKFDANPCSRLVRKSSCSTLFNGGQSVYEKMRKRACLGKVNAFPDLTLMAVMIDHMEGQRDLVTHKSIVHLSDEAIKNVYLFYIMFTLWGSMVFGSMKDPYYDSEFYRKDGGDGSGHWLYEKQEEIEESARAELWREELIDEIEEKVGGLKELEEAGKK